MIQQTTRAKTVAAFALAALLAACVALLAVPAQKAYAAIDRYPVFVSGVQVTSENAADVLGDGTVSFVPSGSTEVPNRLILNDARIAPGTVFYGAKAVKDCGIFLGADANTDIAFQGECFLGYSDAQGSHLVSTGIYSEGFFALRELGASANQLNIRLTAGNGSDWGGTGIYATSHFQIMSGKTFIMGTSEANLNGVVTTAQPGLVTQIDGSLEMFVSGVGLYRKNVAWADTVQVNPGGSVNIYATSKTAVSNVNVVVRGGTFEAMGDEAAINAPYSDHPLTLELGAKALASFYRAGYAPAYYDPNRATQYKWIKAGPAATANIWVGNTPVTSLNANDVLNNGAVRYEFNVQGQALGTGTLYLSDADMSNVNNAFNPEDKISAGVYRQMQGEYPTGDDLTTGLYIGDDVNIVLSGYNMIDVKGDQLEAISGMYVVPGVQVSFDSSNYGHLALWSEMLTGGKAYGIDCEGALSLKGSASIAANGTNGMNANYGVRCQGALVLEDDSVLTATGRGKSSGSSASSQSYGIDVGGSIYTADNSALEGTAFGADFNSVGISYWGQGTVVFNGARVAGFLINSSPNPNNVPTGSSSAAISVYSDAAGYDSLVVTKGTVIASVVGYNGSISALGFMPYFGSSYAPSIKYGPSSANYTEKDKYGVSGEWYRNSYVEFSEVGHGSEYLPAENLWKVVYAGEVSWGSVPSYMGSPMFRDPVRHEWVTLVVSSVAPVVKISDFTVSSGTKVVLAKPDTTGSSEYGYSDMEGDVNLNNKVNIVDAQIAYDCATGKNGISLTWQGKKQLLMADVNSDGFLDAADALNIARAALQGGYSKG